MKILAVSDLHSDEQGIKRLAEIGEKYDLILLAGDLIDRYTSEGDVQKLIEPLASLENLLVVHGNNESKRVLECYRAAFGNRYLNFSSYDWGEFQVIGIGGAVSENGEKHYPDWSARLGEIELSEDKPKVVFSHYPARGLNDFTDSNFHAGIKEIDSFLAEVKPLLFVSGHIHESPGVVVAKIDEPNKKTTVVEQMKTHGSFNCNLEVSPDHIIAISVPYITTKSFLGVEIKVNLEGVGSCNISAASCAGSRI